MSVTSPLPLTAVAAVFELSLQNIWRGTGLLLAIGRKQGTGVAIGDESEGPLAARVRVHPPSLPCKRDSPGMWQRPLGSAFNDEDQVAGRGPR